MRALGGEGVDGISDAGRVAVEIGLGGEGIAGLFVQPGGHASDRLVGVLERSAVGHDQESSWRPVGGAQLRIDRLHTIEGDGGQLFVETETRGDADGQFGELGGDFDDIARQVLLYIDAVDEEIGLNRDRGCACGDTFCDRFGDGGAAVVEEAGLGDGCYAAFAQAGGQPDHGRAAVAVQAAVADEDDAVHVVSSFSFPVFSGRMSEL